MIVALDNPMEQWGVEIRPLDDTPGQFVLDLRPKYSLGLRLIGLTTTDLHDLGDAIDAALAPKPVAVAVEEGDPFAPVGCKEVYKQGVS